MNRFAFSLAPNLEDIHDLHLDATGNLAVIKDAHAVGQHARQRLMAFYGEWFLNTQIGVHWLDEIFGKKYDPALAEAIVKTELLDTEGVTGISGFSVGFSRKRRELIINQIFVETEYNEVVQL